MTTLGCKVEEVAYVRALAKAHAVRITVVVVAGHAQAMVLCDNHIEAVALKLAMKQALKGDEA